MTVFAVRQREAQTFLPQRIKVLDLGCSPPAAIAQTQDDARSKADNGDGQQYPQFERHIMTLPKHHPAALSNAATLGTIASATARLPTSDRCTMSM